MRYIDLGRTISEGMPMFERYPKVTIRRWWTTYSDFHDQEGKPTGYASNMLLIGEHTGTHMDAPIHFNPQGVSLEHVRPDALIGETVVVDVTQRKAHEYYTADDILAWEKRTGERIKEDDIVLFHTRAPELWERPQAYVTEYPGLSLDGARLLRERRVRAVGTDTINLDHPDDFSFPAHITLMRAYPRNILVMENYCSLQLCPIRFWQVCTILKIEGGTASPIRPLAQIP